MAASGPSTVGLFPSVLLTSALAQGQSPTKVGPSLRGEHMAAIGGSVANGLETMPSLNDSSSHMGEYATPDDDLRTVSHTGGSLHQEFVNIS
jgi:hypothetical protein